MSVTYIDSADVMDNGVNILEGHNAILVPGGFGERGFEGKILATKFARENQIPFLGICLGLQAAVIDYARNVAGLVGANSTEFDSECDHPVIALIHEWTTAAEIRKLETKTQILEVQCVLERRNACLSLVPLRKNVIVLVRYLKDIGIAMSLIIIT